MEVHYTSLKVLPKSPFLKPVKSLELAISLLEVKETEKHIEWPLGRQSVKFRVWETIR